MYSTRLIRALAPVLVAPMLAVTVMMAIATPVAAGGPAPDQATVRFEIDFMQDMIDHHAMAVAMAEICLQRAAHEDLRALCQQIIETQRHEIQLMQTWLTDWYGIRYEPEMPAGMTQQMEHLASLNGAKFEIAFMYMMSRHHAQALREADRCRDHAYHEALIDLCENIIATQRAEIAQMQTWLCNWYGICGGPRGPTRGRATAELARAD